MAVKPKSRTILEPLAESAVDSNNSPIKCVALSKLSDDESLIYIGTLSGVLLLYSLRTPRPGPARISFVRRLSLPGSGSGYAVKSIHPLAQIGKIIVLVDGFLYVIDSGLLELAKRVSIFRGVTAFCRKFRSRRYGSSLYSNGGDQIRSGYDNGSSNGDTGCLFAVGIGKKLVLAELVSGGSLVILKEIQGVVDGIIVTVLWLDDSIFVGTKSGYHLYSCINGQCGLIFSLPDSFGAPRLKLLVKESRVMLMVDNVGIIVDVDGHDSEVL